MVGTSVQQKLWNSYAISTSGQLLQKIYKGMFVVMMYTKGQRLHGIGSIGSYSYFQFQVGYGKVFL